jgi:hypothetical protein
VHVTASPCELSRAEPLTTSLEPRVEPLEPRVERGFPKLAEKMAPKMRTRRAHKLACSSSPARCYPRHVVASFCSFSLCSLRRVDAAGLCELPENGLLLARLRGRGVGRPPRRLRRV